MKFFAQAAILVLLLAFPFGHPMASAESDLAADALPGFDADDFDWAYGSTIDSVSVKGNVKTKSIALLRQLESRVGTTLKRVNLERDHRYLTDMSSVATVEVNVYPTREGHCGLLFNVTERPIVFLKLVYPIVEYDFNNERFRFGLRVNDRNFRGRLQSFTLGYTRNSINDDLAYVGWSTDWIGWNHIGLGAWLTYYNRGADAGVDRSIQEQTRVSTALSLPLTESRISFARIICSFAFERNLLGGTVTDNTDEIRLIPSLGYSHDRRDSPLKPTRGGLFWIDLQANRLVRGGNNTYFQLRNDIRMFRSVSPYLVFGLQSNLGYHFGQYPRYVSFSMGGRHTLRGYADSEFHGIHRWFQSLEARITPFPTWIFSVPYAKVVDVSVSFVTFVDAGIVWNNESDFRLDRWRGGYGFGLRVYSPFQDVISFDLGFNRQGAVLFYFGTGIRF